MSKLLTKLIAPCLVLFTIHCSLFTATGQTATATLSGTIQDQNGAVVPGVSVTIVNDATSISRDVTTNNDGYFTATFLPPGTYTLTAKREGFASIQVREIVLNIGDQQSLAVELKVGDPAAPTVDVTDDAFLVNTGTSVSTTIDQTIVQNIPLNGRSFSSLVLLTPGVTVSGASDGFGQFSANGQRTSANNFTVDGVSANVGVGSTTTDATFSSLAGVYPGQSALGGTNNLVSQDALQEFKVQTSSYSAEFGRQPGAQVQVLTRSGGNEFHGSIFEYLRNEAFDARNYFNKKPASQTPLRQNQYGGTFSGPVILPNIGDGGRHWYNGRERTFFFFSYEGQRLRVPAIGTGRVPSLRIRNLAAVSIRPVLNAFPTPTGPETVVSCTPSPSDPLCTPNAGNPQTGTKLSGIAPITIAVSNPSSLDATSVRIDHALNSKNTIFGRFNDSPTYSLIQTGTSIARRRSTANVRTFTAGLTSLISSRVSNELRFNSSSSLGQSSTARIDTGGAVPIDPALLTSGLGGTGTFSMTLVGGLNNASISAGDGVINRQKQINIVDNLSIIKGSHQIKIGTDYRQLNPVYAPQSGQTVQFTSEADVIAGVVSSGTVAARDSARLKFHNFSIFAQDTWKVSRTLTLDLGVRYELNPAPTEADGKRPAVIVGITNPQDVSNATLAPASAPYYKTFYNAIAPRFGAVLNLGRTVFRSGFGVYYDLGASAAGSGFFLVALKGLNAAGGCPAPIVFPLTPSCAARPNVAPIPSLPITLGVNSNAQNLKLPYTLQWNVGAERQVAKGHVLSVSYVGSAGRDLLTAQQINPFVNGARSNPNFSDIRYISNGPSSDYQSMQTQYRARLSTKLQVIANYTWSHSIDEVSSDMQNLVLERGNSSFDVRHNLNGAVHYELPNFGRRSIFKYFLRDWSVDAIVHAQSGLPIDITALSLVAIDGVNSSVRPNYIAGQPLYVSDPTVPGGRRFNLAAFSVPPAGQQGSFGRNVLRHLPLYQLDIAIGRTFRLGERVKAQLKAEAFNVFNRPMFSTYGTSIQSPTLFGIPTQTLNSALGGLSSLYQLGGPRSVQLSARVSF